MLILSKFPCNINLIMQQQIWQALKFFILDNSNILNVSLAVQLIPINKIRIKDRIGMNLNYERCLVQRRTQQFIFIDANMNILRIITQSNL
ncbi:unnamed protein product [Paramecium primaurelia]|uniref:Uncharacterized protein n=1 Tax=Paramecium primaurelia TaxID=5886 RepID=A0A8S1KQU0_PARPR|nr:unnamed protein product [Paramecium primaurelia]